MNCLEWVVSGVLCTIFYMVLGIGVARAVAVMNKEQIRLPYVFMWPIALGVIAACGEVA
jgi:hypothetical protein